jgi:hypothetical protein
VVNIRSIHMAGGTQHQHISLLRWQNPETSHTNESTREAMVAWIRDRKGVARVHGADGSVSTVGVVDADPPYVRSYADGDWNDNLLALPRY